MRRDNYPESVGRRFSLGAGRTSGKVSEFDPKVGRGIITYKRGKNKYKISFSAKDVPNYVPEKIRIGLRVSFVIEGRKGTRAKDVISCAAPARARARQVRRFVNPHPDEVDYEDELFRAARAAARDEPESEAGQGRRTLEKLVAIALLGGRDKLSEPDEDCQYQVPDETLPWPGQARELPAELTPVVETIRKLTPELIRHLKRNEDDLRRIDPHVFEHLVAEFLAGRGFGDVRLVGTNPKTAADIYAARVDDLIGIEHRYFIEVKRWKDKVGVEVIDRVHGAFIGERARIGWHAAIIVSVSGFKEIEKYTPYELRMMGIELKDRGDLLRWLKDYRQREDGLWLPDPANLSL
jgi:cold shock CspA family protein